MKSNSDIRREASKRAGTHWFWRTLVVMIVLGVLPQVISALLGWTFRENGIQTWTGFVQSWAEAKRSGLDYAVPSHRAAWEMTGASLFQLFIVYVFMAISVMGTAVVALKAARENSEGWFRDSFAGFARPLEMLWLMVLTNLRIFLWALLFFVPGVVAVYRYRNAWFLKSDRPDWSAWKCLAESGKMMKGHKWQACCLDVPYFVWIVFATGAWMCCATLMPGNLILRLVTSALSLLLLWWLLRLVVALTIARTVFYREILNGGEESECSSRSSESQP